MGTVGHKVLKFAETKQIVVKLRYVDAGGVLLQCNILKSKEMQRLYLIVKVNELS